jgi:AcrR family transcriptional regulator
MKALTPRSPRARSDRNQSSQRRTAILERAIQLFARDGYAGTDLQELADDLVIGKGTLYRHFQSKQQLFLAAADQVMLKLREHIDARIQTVKDPLDRITRAIHAYLEFFHANPEAVEMLIQERAQFKDRKRPTYFEHREANIEPWRAIYRDLIAAGRIRPLSPERLSDVVGDLLYGTMFVNYIAGRQRPPAQVAKDIIDILFHGILSPSERQARPRSQPATAKRATP